MAAPEVSIIIPTYMEADNLRLLIPDIYASVPRDRQTEIIVVDDDSPDMTEEVIIGLQSRYPLLRLEVRKNKRGISSAVIHGFNRSRGRILVCMDADFSHPPARINALLAPLLNEQADFVIGSRYVAGSYINEQWSLPRWLNSRMATLLARPLTSVHDPMSGFFALPRRLYVDAPPLNSIGYKIGLELLVKTRVKNIVEIPIDFQCRRFGRSKLSFREQIHYLIHLTRLYRDTILNPPPRNANRKSRSS